VQAPPPGGRFRQPQLIQQRLPDYPQLAREIRAAGLVRISAVVDEHGNVKDARVVSGHPMLADAARRAVLVWKYKPATLNGQPIQANVSIEIQFGDGNK
jgi:protein TonB